MGEPARVALVGLHGGHSFGPGAEEALRGATVVVGARRHLDSVALPAGAAAVELGSDLATLMDRIGTWRGAGERVCILVSGDPGFFGLVRLASARLGAQALEVHPVPSSVALAFARLGRHWDDATVVSAHGRRPEGAVQAVLRHPKVAVLCSPDTPPEALGRALLDEGGAGREVAVCSRLGQPDEAVWTGDIPALAAGPFDPLSVVVFLAPAPDPGPGLAWGRPDGDYEHRDGMITKAEVRAVALGKLALPAAGVMWDVGAGSGSVSAEAARLAPGLRIFAVERAPAEADRVRRNVAASAVQVVVGEAPAALGDLPDPDRAFVGGGGIAVLDAVWSRLRSGGTVVATYASPERASAAATTLGSMVQISVNRAVPIGPGTGVRLAAENPVFVCWGSRP